MHVCPRTPKSNWEHYWEKTGNNLNKDLKHAECYSYCWCMQRMRRRLGDEARGGVMGQVVQVLSAMLTILKFAFAVYILPLFLNR